MANKYVADDYILLNLQGLRFIGREDSASLSSPQRYYLKWNYKGVNDQFMYPDKESRDKMFQRVVEALASQPSGPER